MSAPRSDGFGLTRVGIFFLLAVLVVLAAASNTGNNGLFLVLATLVGLFFAGHLLASRNLRRLEARVEDGGELFANSPGRLRFELVHRGRLLPRWLLLVSLDPEDMEPAGRPFRRRPSPLLVSHLAPRESADGHLEVIMRRRGLRKVKALHVVSLFPLGLFRRGRHLPVEAEILVYPEIFDAAATRPVLADRVGEESRRRRGWGHDLYALREYRHGDDPRHIHWKQSARQDRLIFQERESEASRRLSIVFDNAVGPPNGQPLDEADRRRFEHLVSEAATAAVDFLDEGYEVALTTRDRNVPFAAGPHHRRHLLEALALLEVLPRETSPLRGPAYGQSLELSLGRSDEDDPARPRDLETPPAELARSA